MSDPIKSQAVVNRRFGFSYVLEKAKKLANSTG